MNDALIIFIKNPVKGKVKTRLAKTAGDDKALKIYRELLRHTRAIACRINAHRYLFYSQHINTEDEWPASQFKKALQAGGDLGAKMSSAFRQVLNEHNKAVIIGSDCASLTAAIVSEAFRLLDHYDVVMGPAILPPRNAGVSTRAFPKHRIEYRGGGRRYPGAGG